MEEVIAIPDVKAAEEVAESMIQAYTTARAMGASVEEAQDIIRQAVLAASPADTSRLPHALKEVSRLSATRAIRGTALNMIAVGELEGLTFEEILNIIRGAKRDLDRATHWFVSSPQVDLGALPDFIKQDDPRPAREQFNERYVSGWSPLPGFIKVGDDDESGIALPRIQFHGDSALSALAYCKLRDELITVYPGAWVAVTQPDGSFEVARLD